jgi:hypothetical protein
VDTDEYVRQVESALRDLPWRQRRDLLTELREHLGELPPETDLPERLGAPAQYASDLRAAAGLERRRGPIAFARARRPRNVVLALVVLAAAGIVAGFIAWVQSYQPVSWAGGGFLPAQGKLAPSGSTDTITFQKGGRFRWGIPISNNGSFSVRILGLGALAATGNVDVPIPQGLPFSTRLFMNRPSKNWDNRGRPLIHFRPFDLSPGEESLLVLEGTFAKSCRPWQPGDATDLVPGGFLFRDGTLPIRFRFLWKTSTALIPPSVALRIDFPRGCR